MADAAEDGAVPTLVPPDREYMICTEHEHGAVAARGPTAEAAVRQWVKTAGPTGTVRGSVWVRDNVTGEVARVEWERRLRVEDHGLPAGALSAKTAAILAKLPKGYHASVDDNVPTAVYIRRLRSHWGTVARIEVGVDGGARSVRFWSNEDELVLREALGGLLVEGT